MAWFSCLAGRKGEGREVGGVGGYGRGGEGARYPPNTKNAKMIAFFVFGQRIAAEHEKCATNGAFFVFGRWEGGGETGRQCWRP